VKRLLISMAILMAVVCQSCAPAVMGLSTEAKILKSEPGRVYGLFEEEMGKPGHYTGGWLHFPGLPELPEHEYYLQVILVKRYTVTQNPKKP